MSINFCHPVYQPHISTSSVSSDGYEVNNLIKARNGIFKTPGFLAAHFIKPPVDIVCEFPCNIYLDKIIIDPCVGAQKSSSFEVFTKSIPTHSRETWLFDSDAVKKSDAPRRALRNCSDVAVPVGKAFSLENDMTQFTFLNRSFRARPPFFNNDNVTIEAPGFVVREMKHHSPQSLMNVSHVIIRISRVVSGSVPALGRLEIYGQPASFHNSEIRDKVYSLYKSLSEKPLKKKKKSSTSSATPVTSRQRSEKNQISKNIPECSVDFIDPITCEVMSLPVLLPSGSTIDQSTLDKHIVSEARWGRKPSDPFTGIVFTDTKKAIPNAKLKSRIDQFLLKGGDRLKSVPRTVGRATDLHNFGVSPSALVKDLQAIPRNANDAVNLNEDIAKVGLSKESEVSHEIRTRKRKRKQNHSTEELGKRTKNVLDDTATVSREKPKERLPSTVTTTLPQMALSSSRMLLSGKYRMNVEVPVPSSSGGVWKGAQDTRSHEEKLTSSLDDALTDTLSIFGSFKKNSKETDVQHDPEKHEICSTCTKASSSGITMYKLQCHHLLCRACLTKRSPGSKHIKCCKCHQMSSPDAIIRFHSKNAR
ncbi:RING finger protein 37-like [Saccoglossus kowalevskii]|uniref:RING finger protein 37-like n=1 Tax=Saccoglossus kowalevskii TaxID=10224 RepID=A0ABM0GUZ1_SACKO|nr:PREDICTED: RING finger protein 37-like [Saccoglossus kowalevskii]